MSDSSFPLRSSSQSHLRLVTAEEVDSGWNLDDSQLTLRPAFQRVVLPLLTHGSKGYLSDLDTTLSAWERHTADPPVGEIKDSTLVIFRDGYHADASHRPKGASNSPATVNKSLRNLARIFNVLGPRAQNPEGQDIIRVVPYARKLPEGKPVVRIASDRELCDIIEASSCATWPSQFKDVDGLWKPMPGMWRCRLWRFTTVAIRTYGINTGDLLRLTWSQIVPGDPDVEGQRLPDRRYLAFQRQKTKSSKPAAIILPITATLAVHLDRIASPLERVVPWPFSDDMRRGQFEAIQREAGIKPMRFAGGFVKEFLSWQDLRKTANAQINRHRRGMGHHILGHAKRDLNEKYYDEFEEPIREALDTLPMPAAFLGADTQLRLF